MVYFVINCLMGHVANYSVDTGVKTLFMLWYSNGNLHKAKRFMKLNNSKNPLHLLVVIGFTV
jgi:hypothetical protein